MTVAKARKKAMRCLKLHNLAIGSCWNCNPEHEYLKTHGLIVCSECGRVFYNGIDVTIERTADAAGGKHEIN